MMREAVYERLVSLFGVPNGRPAREGEKAVMPSTAKADRWHVRDGLDVVLVDRDRPLEDRATLFFPAPDNLKVLQWGGLCFTYYPGTGDRSRRHSDTFVMPSLRADRAVVSVTVMNGEELAVVAGLLASARDGAMVNTCNQADQVARHDNQA